MMLFKCATFVVLAVGISWPNNRCNSLLYTVIQLRPSVPMKVDSKGLVVCTKYLEPLDLQNVIALGYHPSPKVRIVYILYDKVNDKQKGYLFNYYLQFITQFISDSPEIPKTWSQTSPGLETGIKEVQVQQKLRNQSVLVWRRYFFLFFLHSRKCK